MCCCWPRPWVAACLVAQHAWHPDMGLYHSSTFANNQLGCQVALRSLQALTENDGALLSHVRAMGSHLQAQLHRLVERYPRAYSQVRGSGLLLGLELTEWPGDAGYFFGMVNHRGYRVPLVSGHLLNAHGLLVLPTISRSNVLRIQPALVISRAQIDQAVAALDATGHLIQQGRFDQLVSYLSGGTLPSALCAAEPRPAPFASKPPAAPAKPFASPKQPHLGRFAFLMHPPDMDEMVRCMPLGCEDYPPSSRPACASGSAAGTR